LDKKDFSYAENRDSLKKILSFWIFSKFEYMVIMSFLLIGVISISTNLMYTELISSVYIFVGLYYLVNNKKYEKEKVVIIFRMFIFNGIVLLFFLFYQSPEIQCPVVYPENRFFYYGSECIDI
jgi:sugar phosphate permease